MSDSKEAAAPKKSTAEDKPSEQPAKLTMNVRARLYARINGRRVLLSDSANPNESDNKTLGEMGIDPSTDLQLVIGDGPDTADPPK